MPALGLGVFQTPPDETRAAVEAALNPGYRHIDTAAADGNGREVGEAIAASGVDQGEIFVEARIWISDYGHEETLHGFDKSAAKLGLGHIDLLILHQNFDRGILTQAWSPIGGITFYREGEHTSTLQDPTIVGIAEKHSKGPAQVMLRWHLQRGRSVIPKTTTPYRIAENFDVFDFGLSADELNLIDALDTDKRGGPEPSAITLQAFGRPIPEA